MALIGGWIFKDRSGVQLMTQFIHRYIYYSYKKMRFSNFVGERGDLILERNVFTKKNIVLGSNNKVQ